MCVLDCNEGILKEMKAWGFEIFVTSVNLPSLICWREAGRQLGGMEAERMRQLRVFAEEGPTASSLGIASVASFPISVTWVHSEKVKNEMVLEVSSEAVTPSVHRIQL